MRDFTHGNATKQIILFSVPMLLGNIFQQIYSVADAVVVGRYIGGGALGAIGTAATVLAFLLSVLIGLTTGASVVIAQLYGAKQEARLKRAVTTSLIFLVVLSFFISAIGLAAAPKIMQLLDVPGELFAEAVRYLRICMAGMVFNMLYNMVTAYLRSLGDSKGPLIILIFSSAVNIVLDLILVAYCGFGVGAAAFATVVSQGLACLLCIWHIYRHVPLLRISSLSALVFDKPLFRLILKYSLPAAIQLSMTSLATLTIIRLVNSFGPAAVAGYTAATRIDEFAILPLINISSAVSTFVGQNMGASQEARAKEGFRSSLVFMVGIAVFITCSSLLFCEALITQFVNVEETGADLIISIGTDYLAVKACFYCLFAVFFAFNGFFRGVGDAFIVMAMTMTSLTLRSVSAHFLVARFGFGLEAVAWSVPIGWLLCSLYAILHYKKEFWRGHSVIDSQHKHENLINASFEKEDIL